MTIHRVALALVGVALFADPAHAQFSDLYRRAARAFRVPAKAYRGVNERSSACYERWAKYHDSLADEITGRGPALERPNGGPEDCVPRPGEPTLSEEEQRQVRAEIDRINAGGPSGSTSPSGSGRAGGTGKTDGTRGEPSRPVGGTTTSSGRVSKDEAVDAVASAFSDVTSTITTDVSEEDAARIRARKARGLSVRLPSPGLATALGIVPGLGWAYTGRPGRGFLNLLLVGGGAYGTYWTLNQEAVATPGATAEENAEGLALIGGTLGVIALVAYIDSIFGARAYAESVNDAYRLARSHVEVRPVLVNAGPRAEAPVVGMQVGLRFRF